MIHFCERNYNKCDSKKNVTNPHIQNSKIDFEASATAPVKGQKSQN